MKSFYDAIKCNTTLVALVNYYYFSVKREVLEDFFEEQ